MKQLGFHVVGYGCTTCIGNVAVAATGFCYVPTNLVCSVLSGKSFEGRVSQDVRKLPPVRLWS